jgi:hypothetical protein
MRAVIRRPRRGLADYAPPPRKCAGASLIRPTNLGVKARAIVPAEAWAWPQSLFTMSNSPTRSTTRSRGAFAPGVCKLFHPVRGGGADRRPVLARHRWPACEAGRGACEAPRRPLRSGRRASRRSTPWRFWASGPRFRLRHFLRSTCSQLLAARVVVPGERFPSLPSPWLRATAAGRHLLLHLQDASGRRPSLSRNRTYIEQPRIGVKFEFAVYRKIFCSYGRVRRRPALRLTAFYREDHRTPTTHGAAA